MARNANSGEYPGQVALYMPGNRFGEGVVLNRNHALTVATNCFDLLGNRLSPSGITVRAGTINISGAAPALMLVMRIYAHEGFNRFNLRNNIAVLRVSERFLESVVIRSLRVSPFPQMSNDFAFEPNNPLPFLAAAPFSTRIVPETTNCELVGWNAPPSE